MRHLIVGLALFVASMAISLVSVKLFPTEEKRPADARGLTVSSKDADGRSGGRDGSGGQDSLISRSPPLATISHPAR